MKQILCEGVIRVLLLVVIAAAATAPANPAVGQEDWDPRRVYMTRVQLQDLLDRLELTAQSSAYSGTLRARTRIEADLVRERLRDGDFKVGDRILLEVESEPTLTDTFTVAQGRLVNLPLIGEVDLAGLLRAELEAHLTEFVGTFLREPTVHARSLIPITITGAVGRPGFYTVPSELLLTDAINVAGGLNPTAEITDIEIERGNERIWEGERLQDAIAAGQTLDQLSLAAGDRINVPAQGTGLGGSYQTMRAIGFILAIPAMIAGLISIF